MLVRHATLQKKDPCNKSGAMTVVHGCAAESGSFETDQQPGTSSPLTAAHALRRNAEAWGLLPTVSLGDKLNSSAHPAPQDLLTTSHQHHWEDDKSPHLRDTMPHDRGLGTGPHDPSRSRGAYEQLQALAQIDHLQQAGKKRKMVEVSKALTFTTPSCGNVCHAARCKDHGLVWTNVGVWIIARYRYQPCGQHDSW